MLTRRHLLCGEAHIESPEEFVSSLAAEVAKWRKNVVDDACIKGQLDS